MKKKEQEVLKAVKESKTMDDLNKASFDALKVVLGLGDDIKDLSSLFRKVPEVDRQAIALLTELIPEFDRRVHEILENRMIFPELLEKARRETAYVQYGVFKTWICRGPMCPDPFYEIHSNFTRGRMVKKQPNKEQYYRYGFDEKGRLLYAEHKSKFSSVEVLLREGNSVWGLELSESALESMSEVAYRTDLRFCVSYIKDNRIVAMLQTDYFDMDTVPLSPFVYCKVIHYDDAGMPDRYTKCPLHYERDGEGNPVHLEARGSVRDLILNEKGDVIKIHDRKDGSDAFDPERVITLPKPVPRERWDNLYGLI